MTETIFVRAGSTRQQAVVDRLREMVMDGTFKAGDRLLEVALSNQLEVSRTPIREALIILAEDGLVEYRPNRGYVVRHFSLSYIMDAYSVRETLEGLACRLAAEKGVSAEIQQALKECLEKGDDLLSGNRLRPSARDPWGRVNNNFHQLLVMAADNEPLAQALTVATNIPYASSRVVHWFDEGDVEGLFQLRAVHAQHHAIVEAILAGQGHRAETIIRGHIAYAAEHIRTSWAKPTRQTKKRLKAPRLVVD